ncbi:acyltransferase family protein [Bradyrhizobium sp. UFLA01-814]|uniref:acyltransferase family protein n=1 Tax=Bradyrhizobium sp. UFLA01-814 TaxID=3023480 RepID=UPI00398B350A
MVSNYRADIDGLRAVSVLLVFLFHYEVPAVSGGFIGVDVFFVISGYLITGILITSMRTQQFSLAWFYERRIRRILPALLTTVFVTLVAGWVLLMPGDYRDAASSALASIGAVSNVFFLNNTGYVDHAAALLPLLHTWSLGVEEQFYVVWPLALAWAYGLMRGRPMRVFWFIATVIVVSFVFNVWQTAATPKAAFFLPFSRAWELAAGAIVVLLPRPKLPPTLREVLPLLGLAMILAAGVSLAHDTPFPGWRAAPPVLGAALLLFEDDTKSVIARVLGTRLFVAIGKISYSLYLFHWPVLALYRHYAGTVDLGPTDLAVAGAIAFLVSVLCYLFVEQPCRRARLSRRSTFKAAGAATAVVVLGTVLVAQYDGMPGRIPPEMAAVGSLDGMWKWPCPEIAPVEVATFAGPARSSHLCALGAPWTTARDRALVWGDSNAEHLLPILNWTGLADNTAIGLVNPCPGIVENGKVERYWPDNPAYSSQCGRQRASVLELLRNRPEIGTVILSARWSDLPTMLYRGNSNVRSEALGLRLLSDSLRDLLDEIGPSKKVIVFVDIPKVPVGNPAACAMADQALLRRPCPANLESLIWRNLTEVQQPAQDVVREAAAGRPNVIVLDPGNALCADGRCRVWFNGEFLYRDPDHFRRNLSQSTNAALAERLGFLAALQPMGVK